MRNLILFIVCLVPSFVNACSDFNWQWKVEDWINGSDAIHHGIVVSMSLSEKSINDGETDPLLNVVALRGEEHITFKVFETFKGKPRKILKVVLPECIGGVTEFGDTGLLFKVGKVWHIKPNVGKWANPIAGEIIEKLSKKQHRFSVQP